MYNDNECMLQMARSVPTKVYYYSVSLTQQYKITDSLQSHNEHRGSLFYNLINA